MTSRRTLTRGQMLALATYVVGLLGTLAVVWLASANVAARRANIQDQRDALARLDARIATLNIRGGAPAGVPVNPFLDGDTVTVAGANLQERVVAMIRNAGGTVTSSEVDLSDAKTAPQRVALTASCELEQDVLQQLLYDIEAGTPFLYLDQIVIQSDRPDARSAAGGAGPAPGHLRVSLTVSGYWRGTT
ncbi:MAG: type II secretion system protein M [Methylobacteriaceae bacterium]|nr:type II secretion system protein M [Methylobacteriaceae bacterium]MBV9221697.1 type II secretion system protein M [Methylobacteriaceae bacterium]